MNFIAALRDLAQAEVEFVVVGGVAAVLGGVPSSTFDLDIVHARTPENRRRLYRVLVDLDACYREHLPKILKPSLADLDVEGHLLLETRHGYLDLLGTVAGRRGFSELVDYSIWMELDEDVRVRVLDLGELIRLKEQTDREKDRLQLPLLRRTLEEREKIRNGGMD